MTVRKDLDMGTDLVAGIERASVPRGSFVVGHVDEERVLLAHLDDGFHAVSATCTHYGADLGGGLLVGSEVRCPCHHASFDLRTGAALRSPAVRRLNAWHAEVKVGRVLVTRKKEPSTTLPGPRAGGIRRIVIVGGGAAGYAAAERIHARGFDGELSIISADSAAPYDRTNLSKGIVAGTAPREWLPLAELDEYARRGVSLKLNRKVSAIDCGTKRIITERGGHIPFDALLLATGAKPRRLAALGGFENVFELRSLRDAERLIARASDPSTRSVVVVGSGGFYPVCTDGWVKRINA